jgi:hypothetical protein
MLGKPLEAGELVELSFQTNKGTIHGMAEVLEPRVKASSGCLQSFRFIALEDEAHSSLSTVLESLLDQIAVGSGLRLNAVLGLR